MGPHNFILQLIGRGPSLWDVSMGVSLNGGPPKTPQNDHF